MEGGAERQRQIDPPWLLTSYGEENEKHSFYDVANNRFHTRSIPELCGKYICASVYGWLVLVDFNNGECCLWNPESMAKIELPDLQNAYHYNKCVLSKPPTDPDCHILFISQCTFYRSFCQVGDDEFVVEQLEMGQGVHLLAAVSFKGEIYGLTSNYNQFVTVHFVDNKTSLEFRPVMIEEEGEEEPWHIPNALRSYITGIDSYLMESPCCNDNNNQILLLAQKMYSPIYTLVGFDFKIFRLDLCKMECEELESLEEDQTIFLGHRSTAAVCTSSTKSGIRANSIYYTDVKGRNLYIYDLDDKGRTLLLPCPAAKRSESVHFWIEHQVSQKLVHSMIWSQTYNLIYNCSVNPPPPYVCRKKGSQVI